jgi:hypothetical protein
MYKKAMLTISNLSLLNNNTIKVIARSKIQIKSNHTVFINLKIIKLIKRQVSKFYLKIMQRLVLLK